MLVRYADRLIGLVLPLPIFFDFTGPYYLASQSVGQGATALPISLFFLPLSLLVAAVNFRAVINYANAIFVVGVAGFVLWLFIVAGASLFEDSNSLFYAIQWGLPFFWVPYFLGLSAEFRLFEFVRGIFVGTFLAVLYIFFSGVAEVVMYGALMDSGRLTQNLVILGQYQLYVYVPTLLAFSTLLVCWFTKSGFLRVQLGWLLSLNVLAFSSLLFLGAREGILVYLMGLFVFLVLGSVRRILLSVSLLFLCMAVFALNFDHVTEYAQRSELRSMNKFAALASPGKSLGARDEMIAQYLEVVNEDALLGSRILPPNTAFPSLNISAPSAHNYYVDVFARLGLIGAIPLYLVVIVGVASATYFLVLSFRKEFVSNSRMCLLAGVSSCLLIYLFVSNNVNVPMRQPLTAPILSFFMVFVISGLKKDSA